MCCLLSRWTALTAVRTLLMGALVLTVAGWAASDSLAMGPGMMGAGSMGPGMMGSAPGPASPEGEHAGHGAALVAYIQAQHLACLQCHGVETSGFGPAFALIATNYAKQPDAARSLAERTAQGYGRMPGGLANDVQAARLAKMILELPEAARVQPH